MNNQQFPANVAKVSRLDDEHTIIRFFSEVRGFQPKETIAVNFNGSKEQLIKELQQHG